MRLPRQDTPLSLPAEHPREALVRDEALLDQVRPGGPTLSRWWVADSPAIVVGLGLWHRVAEVVDLEACQAAGIEVVSRRAGGGALLLDDHMLCGAICVPSACVSADLTESYRWLGDLLASEVHGRRVEVDAARADVAALRSRPDVVAQALLATCFGALSPHEVVVGSAKVVGLAQIRRRHAALFQIGILLRDQSPLADYLALPDEPTRQALRDALRVRTSGLDLAGRSVSEVVAAVGGATPCAP